MDVTLIRQGVEKITTCPICHLPLMGILGNGCAAEVAVFGALAPEHALLVVQKTQCSYHCRGTGLKPCEQRESSVSSLFTAPVTAANVLGSVRSCGSQQTNLPSLLFVQA